MLSRECHKIKYCGLDQYAAEIFEQRVFRTAGVGGVKVLTF